MLVYITVRVNTFHGIFHPYAFTNQNKALQFIADENAKTPSPYKDFSELFAVELNSVSRPTEILHSDQR